MDMAPPFIGEALLVVTKEEELRKFLVGDRGDILRPRNMRLAGPTEFQFRAIFLAIGAVDQKHARLRGCWKDTSARGWLPLISPLEGEMSAKLTEGGGDGAVESIEKSSGGVTPLCPAGHLPHKGGDRYAAPSPRFSNVERGTSPLPVGGGPKDRRDPRLAPARVRVRGKSSRRY